jgi:Restriction endonuclease
MDASVQWRTYEQVAQYLLNEFASHFGLGQVEGKQIVTGTSGTDWEIDAKGVEEDGKGFLVVECRRYNSRLKQKDLAALAFTIDDAGATGGIVVTPLDLQAGAKLIAAHANIHHVRMTPDSTTTDYIVEFLGRRFIGASLSETLSLQDQISCEVVRADGTMERR